VVHELRRLAYWATEVHGQGRQGSRARLRARLVAPHEVERILGEGIAPFRDKVVITSKFGFDVDLETGERRPARISRPDRVKLAVEGMLKRLRTDRIDLLYQHRVDPEVPIEDVAGAVKKLMAEGKVLHWFPMVKDLASKRLRGRPLKSQFFRRNVRLPLLMGYRQDEHSALS
jgi:hypothetical protein